MFLIADTDTPLSRRNGRDKTSFFYVLLQPSQNITQRKMGNDQIETASMLSIVSENCLHL